MNRRGTKQFILRHWKALAISTAAVFCVVAAGYILLPRLIGQNQPTGTGESTTVSSQSGTSSSQETTKTPTYLNSEQLLIYVFRGFSFPSKDQAANYYEKIPIEQRDGISCEDLAEYVWRLRNSMTSHEKISGENSKILIEEVNWEELYRWKSPIMDSKETSLHAEWTLQMMHSDRAGLQLYKISNASNDGGRLYYDFFFFLVHGDEYPRLPGDYISGALRLEEQLNLLNDSIKSGNTDEMKPFIELGAISKEKRAADPGIYQRKALAIVDVYRKFIEPSGDKTLRFWIAQVYDKTDHTTTAKWKFYDLMPVRWVGDPDQNDDASELPDMMFAFINPHGQLKVRQEQYDVYSEFLPGYCATSLVTGKTLEIGQLVYEKDLIAFFGPENPPFGQIGGFEDESSIIYQYGLSEILISGENILLEHDFFGEIGSMILQGDQYVPGYSILHSNSMDDILAAWPILEDWLKMETIDKRGDGFLAGNDVLTVKYGYTRFYFYDNRLARIILGYYFN